ncbi:MAG TPA: hypothetical protein VMI92_11205 [Steroidobacteraceae bacterium]|nr:hypothetical protein [Steroidobacteraceae bacterium]
MAIEGRKQAVSIRLNAADVRNLRKLSRRLGVRNSDVIRFAIKHALARLGPLCESEVQGRALVPVLVDAGADLMRYLDLGVADLEALVNEGTPPDQQVDRADVQLLAMSSLPAGYARLRLVRIGGTRVTEGTVDPAAEDGHASQSLRKYLYDKYVYASGGADAPAAQSGVQP